MEDRENNKLVLVSDILDRGVRRKQNEGCIGMSHLAFLMLKEILRKHFLDIESKFLF